MKQFTKEELARCNGQGGAPVYVAYQGKVYDVSGSDQWQGGDHQGLHTAGAELTASLDDEAPHGAEVFEGFPVVGTLPE
jgi:predicted heme/steroid binding protein